MDISSKRHYSGQLYKYTNVMKGWQYRFFTLDPQAGTLQYYLCEGGEKIVSENGQPRGSVHLAAAVICPSDEDSKTFTVNCASGDMLKLRASDARERQEWVNTLRAVAESHTRAIGSTGPPMAPREHLAVLDAFGCVRSQLHRTEQADALLCRILEGINNYHTDHNLLRLKATSAAALHTLTQCLAILQRTQHNENAMTASSVFYRPCPPSNTKLKEANEENNH
ncbi:oxysterol-binding protein-related protein 11 [Chrysoperla carnea]|uniref:oxysterol-binding protein-related protein 11 n=1 Tax=Chrysoperla carnea TaxID=189513 RepID=UPI001D0977D6|nr:oxysterol-binding protein-related protein 11 [Chrysoperla carnea]